MRCDLKVGQSFASIYQSDLWHAVIYEQIKYEIMDFKNENLNRFIAISKTEPVESSKLL